MKGDTIVIEPPSGWRMVDLRKFRDLFYFLVWRDIKVLYAQTVLGFAWAILNPTIQILIFTVIFGNVAKISSDGFPYMLFSTVAVVPWTYMSTSMSNASIFSARSTFRGSFFRSHRCSQSSSTSLSHLP